MEAVSRKYSEKLTVKEEKPLGEQKRACGLRGAVVSSVSELNLQITLVDDPVRQLALPLLSSDSKPR